MKRKTVIKTRKTQRAPAMVKLIKRVTMKQMETKTSGFYVLGQSLFHNQSAYVTNFLATDQGVGSPSYFSTTINGQRIGDKIHALGIKFQLYHETADTRPNSCAKVFVFSYNSNQSITDAVFWQGSSAGGGNLLRMIDTPNNDNVTILKSFVIQHQPNYYESASGFSTRNCGTYRAFYVKIDRNITYLDDNSRVPKGRDIGFAIVGCDLNGTIQTDRVGYYNLSAQVFYKDA
jgi:hypothetical protein